WPPPSSDGLCQRCNPFGAAMAEAAGFPIWPRHLRHGARTVARLVTGFRPQHVPTTMRFFHIIFWPRLLRAVFGEKLEQLREQIEPHVARSVASFGRVNFSVKRYRRDMVGFQLGTLLPIHNPCS